MKTVAEIIGWERPHLWIYDHEYSTYSCHWCSKASPNQLGFEPGPSVGCLADAPCSDDDPPQPTPDDMLAWLADNGYMCLRIDYGRPDPLPVGIQFLVAPIRASVWGTYGGTTLHAALEAAVRAVHDAEEAGK